ncbi:hypothetical protein TNCV_4755441 [Trichonephila clavipes]|nr:hypothetical protein TNCV_4755441 [Trichonephila clavipes]
MITHCATLDSGTNLIIINKKYVSEEKRINSQIVLKSESEESGSTDAACIPVCLQNETERKNNVGVSGVGLPDVRFSTGQSSFLYVSPVKRIWVNRTKECPVLNTFCVISGALGRQPTEIVGF